MILVVEFRVLEVKVVVDEAVINEVKSVVNATIPEALGSVISGAPVIVCGPKK